MTQAQKDHIVKTDPIEVQLWVIGGIGTRQIILYGINARLYEWLKTQHARLDAIAKRKTGLDFTKPIDTTITWSQGSILDLIALALGGDWPEEMILASWKLSDLIWAMRPQLGPRIFAREVTHAEFGRSFHHLYRDHTAHQVKVYFTGLYLYSNIDRLRDAVNADSTGGSGSLNAEGFETAWIAAALAHDNCYRFESSDFNDPASAEQKNTWNLLSDALAAPVSATRAFPEFSKKHEDLLNTSLKITPPLVASIAELGTDPLHPSFPLWTAFQKVSDNATLAEASHNGVEHYWELASRQDVTRSDGSVLRPRHYDHGIAAALTLLKITRQLKLALQQLRQRLHVPFGGRGGKRLEKEFIELDDACERSSAAISAAAGAIALHNINLHQWEHLDEAIRHPISLPSAYSLSLESTPLALLLGLADSLQDWDRPHYSAPREGFNLLGLKARDIDLWVAEDKSGAPRIALRFHRDALAVALGEPEGQTKRGKTLEALRQYLEPNDLAEIFFATGDQPEPPALRSTSDPAAPQLGGPQLSTSQPVKPHRSAFWPRFKHKAIEPFAIIAVMFVIVAVMYSMLPHRAATPAAVPLPLANIAIPDLAPHLTTIPITLLDDTMKDWSIVAARPSKSSKVPFTVVNITFPVRPAQPITLGLLQLFNPESPYELTLECDAENTTTQQRLTLTRTITIKTTKPIDADAYRVDPPLAAQNNTLSLRPRMNVPIFSTSNSGWQIDFESIRMTGLGNALPQYHPEERSKSIKTLRCYCLPFEDNPSSQLRITFSAVPYGESLPAPPGKQYSMVYFLDASATKANIDEVAVHCNGIKYCEWSAQTYFSYRDLPNVERMTFDDALLDPRNPWLPAHGTLEFRLADGTPYPPATPRSNELPVIRYIPDASNSPKDSFICCVDVLTSNPQTSTPRFVRINIKR